jgi:hypothetical protein
MVDDFIKNEDSIMIGETVYLRPNRLSYTII